MHSENSIDIQNIVNSFSKASRINVNVFLLEAVIIRPGCTRRLRTNISLQNIPDSHRFIFNGVKKRSGVYIKEGTVDTSASNFFYVYVHNVSLKHQFVKAKSHLGSLNIIPYIMPEEYDWVYENYLHGNHRHICVSSCPFFHNI